MAGEEHGEPEADGEMGDTPATVYRFACALCEKPAAMVTLAADGTIVVEGIVCRVTQNVGVENGARLRDLLARRDPRALYAVNEEWASFYCPTCDRAYCRDHWQLDVRYDDDFPGWYDCTYGTCPRGHRRLMDD